METKIVCPNCKEDNIQKITGIRHTGVSTGSFSGPTGGVTYADKQWGSYGGYSTLSGSSSTDLAKMLEPPVKPVLRKYTDWGTGCGLAFLAMFTIFLATVISQSQVGFVVALVFWIGLAVLYRESFEKLKKVRDAEFLKEYQEKLSMWEAAMSKFDRCFYCFKDDLIFDPETGSSCTPDKFQTWIFAFIP